MPSDGAPSASPGSLRGIARTSGAVLRTHGLHIWLACVALLLPGELVALAGPPAASLDAYVPTPAASPTALVGAALTAVLAGCAELGVAAFTARVLGGGHPGGAARLFADAVRGFGRVLPVQLVYSNRISVGLLLVSPGVAWLVYGRFLYVVAALRPTVEPFAGSRAVVRGDWPRQALLTLVRGLCVLVVPAGATLVAPVLGVSSVLSAGLLGAWAVVDTVTFLERERTAGPLDPATVGP